MAADSEKKSKAAFAAQLILKNKIVRCLFIALSTFLYCEFFHYGVVLIQCTWPAAPSEHGDLKVMFIADTHLLGFVKGHFLDRLRREWQMKQAFQTSMLIHKPDAVFVLGDLLDEGEFCSDRHFNYHVSRFRSMFQVPQGTKFHVVSGNHDEGFHHTLSMYTHRRFQKAFNSSSVRLVKVKKIPFVLVNSMAMAGDGCSLCQAAEKKINSISKKLQNHQNCQADDTKGSQCQKYDGVDYVKPILLQHFPMHRPSDAKCNLKDSARGSEKFRAFKVGLDCLDIRSTDMLFTKIQPRLVVSAHTHHGCYHVHPNGVPEWSVSSFSWRNRNNPTFLMARIHSSNFTTKQCFLPEESTVNRIYIVCGVVFLVSVFFPFSKRRLKKNTS